MADLGWKLPKEVIVLIMDVCNISVLSRVCVWFSCNVPVYRYEHIDASHVTESDKIMGVVNAARLNSTRSLKVNAAWTDHLASIGTVHSLTSLDGLHEVYGYSLTPLTNLTTLRMDSDGAITMGALLALPALTSLHYSEGIPISSLYDIGRLSNLVSLCTYVRYTEDLRSMTRLLSLSGTIYTDMLPRTLTHLTAIYLDQPICLPALLSLHVRDHIEDFVLCAFTSLTNLSVNCKYWHADQCDNKCGDSCNNSYNHRDMSVSTLTSLTSICAPLRRIRNDELRLLTSLTHLNIGVWTAY